MLTDKRIGVLMGGTSAEREISLRSGTAIYNALKVIGYKAFAIDVGPDICNVLNREGIELAFLVLHGGYGENGSIQGMLEVLGIPYTGSGVLASALAMDKEASKKIFLYHNIPIPPFVVVTSNELLIPPLPPLVKGGKGGFDSSLIDFPLPWVVKPTAEGSSIGISIVRDKMNFRQALEAAYSHGSRVIVEKYIMGKEVHIGILNGRVLGGVEVRPSLEFYNYEAKYTAGRTEYILPPEINNKAYERAKEAAISAHTALGCKGATRVDLRVDTEGNPYVLEVNTIPGMTEMSLLPKIASLAGFDFPALIEEIIRGVIDEGQ
ncbi:MAG: D-alanine--D-alanine ligase [Nitrospirae bacterium CG_4_10_14_0_8_um_filter_41_23]|nr:D-alanine--D-alanine ligase [Nitrospirota bacterium]OIP58814.1 MAG: D-alanine--D-alanine ligase [Nitrospirae bacterium CG2_30_41_42]PIQ95093.1 MAG: D-alanine--D-alanine ligase [Nitrospirae bacterium CG11_big_fil_rev_8_21_14_0_20_41_14]PIV41653.1 MAG: D-alanine--D-alanine ligase [Nitrospirae bacterium CG02_land_8_20_14_3_00_41_53]PIW86701.1 MAG: D-alanine--D-alanine ligase [Nitrospirae bacterium CG_4_8_14_3_um_filter_41_47]PIY86262.1 MAG: D-alanine--D-alanine ligase [Nitrospirae bacterium CG